MRKLEAEREENLTLRRELKAERMALLEARAAVAELQRRLAEAGL